LITKLQSKLQTIYNDAEPQIQLILQRAKRYIGAGIEFEPYTVREGTGLGAMDISIRKEDRRYYPDKVFMVYVLNGIAKVCWQDYISAIEDKDNWEFLYDLGSAVDVATEFDGEWQRVAKDAELCFDSPAIWIHVTIGEPWFFWVTPTGALMAQQGQGTPLELASSGVTKVSAIRGWKSVPVPADDQGLIVAYIKNGEVCYRNLAEQADTTVIWESEKVVTQFGASVQNIGTFRTNDFRSGIVAEVNGDIQWVITQRDWSGMGVPPEIIHTSITDLSVDLIPINYHWGYDTEIISASITNLEVGFLWASNTLPISAENIAMTDTVTAEEVGTGDGVQTVFSLLHEPTTQTIYIDGVETTDYTVSGKDITFNTAPTGIITGDYTWENWGKLVKLTFDHGVSDSGLNTEFALSDGASNPYAVSGTQIGANWGLPVGHFDGSREIILTTTDFNSATNPIEVVYTAGTIKGESGQVTESFTISFTAINLDAPNIPAPEVLEVWNE
jgi:hypothetical protein